MKDKEITRQTTTGNSKDKAASEHRDAAHPHGLSVEQINNLKPGSYTISNGKLKESEVK